MLVLPKREVQSLELLSEDESLDFWKTINLSKKIIDETLHPHGVNIGMNIGSAAGAGLPQHLHCHIVPRWDGDNNFMPIIADTKVLPTALEVMWKNLKQVADKIVK